MNKRFKFDVSSLILAIFLDLDVTPLVTEIFYAANQIYSTPWSWEPPWIPYLGRVLWIHVRCSGGDGTGDPHNICHDKNDLDDPGCPPLQKASPAGAALEAYTENTGKDEKTGEYIDYTRTTFCNAFFNLPSLKEATDRGKNLLSDQQNNLEYWNNRARVFLHEATHIHYFMNTPDKSPDVDDLIILWKEGGQKHEDYVYGPYRTKILRNWLGDGTFPQRNGE